MWKSLLILQPHYSIFLDAAQQHFQVIFGSKVGEGRRLRKQEDIQEETHENIKQNTPAKNCLFCFVSNHAQHLLVQDLYQYEFISFMGRYIFWK